MMSTTTTTPTMAANDENHNDEHCDCGCGRTVREKIDYFNEWSVRKERPPPPPSPSTPFATTLSILGMVNAAAVSHHPDNKEGGERGSFFVVSMGHEDHEKEFLCDTDSTSSSSSSTTTMRSRAESSSSSQHSAAGATPATWQEEQEQSGGVKDRKNKDECKSFVDREISFVEQRGSNTHDHDTVAVARNVDLVVSDDMVTQEPTKVQQDEENVKDQLVVNEMTRRMTEKDARIADLLEQVETLQREKDAYVSQVERLQRDKDQKDACIVDLSTRVQELQRDKDEIMNMMIGLS